jgi:hypothetical protein
MATKNPPLDPVVTISTPAPSKAPPPAVAPPKLGELPSAFDPGALAALAKARDDLRNAESRADTAAHAKAAADAADEIARAQLDAARKNALLAATSLLGADLADNFIAITDAEAARLGKDAGAVRKGVPEHVRARLFGA